MMERGGGLGWRGEGEREGKRGEGGGGEGSCSLTPLSHQPVADTYSLDLLLLSQGGRRGKEVETV